MLLFSFSMNPSIFSLLLFTVSLKHLSGRCKIHRYNKPNYYYQKPLTGTMRTIVHPVYCGSSWINMQIGFLLFCTIMRQWDEDNANNWITWPGRIFWYWLGTYIPQTNILIELCFDREGCVKVMEGEGCMKVMEGEGH